MNPHTFFKCSAANCSFEGTSLRGLSQHRKAQHPRLANHESYKLNKQNYIRYYHPVLTGMAIEICFLLYANVECAARPCAQDGSFIHPASNPPASTATSRNPWFPFEDRLAFEWAHEHFVKVQSSKKEIGRGLELWRAALRKGGCHDELPWRSADEMYATIDSIQDGSTPWSTFILRYNGPKPDRDIPLWMEEEYEVNTRDALEVVCGQISTPEFDGEFDYRPFKEFNPSNERVWSNLMSGEFAFDEAVRLFLFTC
jgi:hypothetical protein